MKNLHYGFLLGMAFLTSGCVATSTFQYEPPDVSGKIENEAVLDENFESVWKRAVKNLSSDFFVINNIEKASGLINLSFSSQNPSEFVDCGFTSRTFQNATGKQQYSYKTAESSRYTFATDDGLAFNTYRKTSLDGRVNIYIAPENNKTIVRVNTRYILNIDLKFLNLYGRPAGSENVTWAFNTNAPYKGADEAMGEQIRCTTTYEIEGRILRATGATL